MREYKKERLEELAFNMYPMGGDEYTMGFVDGFRAAEREIKSDLIHSVSESDSSDFELQRLFDWLQDTKREPSQTKFTAGMTRNVAREFEYLLKHSR